ncbi:MAG: putative hemolysin [Acidobacteria bacterium]|nr:putative hemolysin [Acidobacteriota bacterium]
MIRVFPPAVISRLTGLRNFVRRSPGETFASQTSRTAVKPTLIRSLRRRVALLFCLVLAAAVLVEIAQSQMVHARLAKSGGKQAATHNFSFEPQTDKTASHTAAQQASQETSGPLGAINFSNTYTGPVFPQNMPFGATFVTGDPTNIGKIGRAGGNTWYFSNVTLPSHCSNPNTFWGPANNLVRLSFVSNTFTNTPGEVLTFQPGQSNLPGGIAVWTGFTFNPSSGQQVFTKFTMTANLHSGAAPGGAVGSPLLLLPPTNFGLQFSQGGMVQITPSIDYQINMRFDASFTNGSGYSPALDFYDANSTAGGTCFESFTAGFYYRNFLPVISDNGDKSTLINTPSGPHDVYVFDCETAAASLALSGSSSNTTLLPNANITFGGSGNNRTVLLTPASNQFGTTTVTLSVFDGIDTISDTFNFVVDAPPSWVTSGGTVGEPTGNESDPVQRSLNQSLGDQDSGQTLTFSLAGGTGNCGASSTHPFTGLSFSPPTTPTTGGNTSTNLLFNVGANDGASSPYCVRVNANDGYTDVTRDMVINVTQQNSDPLWITSAGTVDEPTGSEANPIARTISLSLNDADPGQTLSFALAGGTGNCGASSTHPFTALSFDPAAEPTVSGNESTLLHLSVGANDAAGSPYCVRVTASDGTATATKDLSVTVTPHNSNPTISDVTNQLTQRNQATAAIPFTIGDIDGDDPATALIMSGGSGNTTLIPNGNIVFGGSGASRYVTITPANNQTGTSTITLTVTDTHGATASDTFDLRVNAPPVFDTNAGLALNQGATATITNSMLNVTDADNTAAQLKYTVAPGGNGGPSHEGTLKLNNVALTSGSFFTQDDVNNNRVTYTNNGSNQTSDTFQFNITDGDGATLPNDGVHLTFTFGITITLINHAPVAVDGNGSTGIGAPFNGTFAATDPDTFAQTLMRRIVTNGSKGTAVLNDATTGAFTYTPNPQQTGQDTIVFQVNDGSLDSVNPGTFTIDIQNAAPTAQNASGNATEGVALNGILTGSDPDQPPQPFTFAIAGNPSKGNVNITNPSTGAFTYTPNANAFGADSFTFTVSDGLLTSAPGTFSITIKPNLDAGDVFVTNTSTTGPQAGVVVQIDPNNGSQFVVSSGGSLTNPSAIIIEHDGKLVVLDRNNNVFKLVRVDPSSGAQSVIPNGPVFQNPVGLGIGPGADLFVADPFAGSVFEVNPTTGALVHTFSGGNLGGPVGIAFDADGNLLVSDAAGLFGGSSKIVRINTATDAQTVVTSGGGLLLPADIALDSNGDIIVSDAPNLFGPGTGSLLRVNAISGVQTVITGAGLGKPSGVAVEYSNNNSFTPDNGAASVLMTTPAGTTTTAASGEFLSQPYGIAMIQNAAPIASDSSVNTGIAPIVITPVARDVETPSANLKFTAAAALHGQVSPTSPCAVFPCATITYTPDPNYSGSDSFTFTAVDEGYGFAPPRTSNTATVSINVQAASISGHLNYLDSTTGARNVTLTLTGLGGFTTRITTTDTNGDYTFADVPTGNNYTVTPSRVAAAHDPSITAFDASKAARFEVNPGAFPLTANQQTAGDSSNNGSVTAFDASQIARYELTIPSAGIAGSWKFKPANLSINNLSATQTGQNLTAILVGDITGNWIPSGPSELATSAPTATIIVSLPIKQDPPGGPSTIPITVGDTTGQGIGAYAFDISFDPTVLQPQATPYDSTGTLSSGWLITPNTSTSGHLILNAFNTSDMTGQGVLLNLKFNVIGAPASTSPLTWVNFTFNEGTPADSDINGSFTATGPSAAVAGISGQIVDAAGQPVAGTTVTVVGGSSTIRAITDSNGFYRVEGLEAGGFYTVTPSRANYVFAPANRSFSLVGSRTDAMFTGTVTAPDGNPLESPEFFVRQQYLDFLGREPEQSGLAYWGGQLRACGNDGDCIKTLRTSIASAFYIAQEFQDSGLYIYDVYEGALGRRPVHAEYAVDRRTVVGGPHLETNKTAFARSFVERAEFTTQYPLTMSDEVFVDALLRTAQQSSGLDLSRSRAALIALYNSGANPSGSTTESRSLVLRSVAEDSRFKQTQYNAAFVLMEYYGYLGRNPDAAGYDFWLNVLNDGAGNNYRGMVCSFITSAEYQRRFSVVVTRNNSECGSQ